MNRRHRMPFGAEQDDDGSLRVALWAPGAEHVDVEFESAFGRRLEPMRREPGGWFRLISPGFAAGTRYRFSIDDRISVPDPASRANPDDVHAASMVVDPLAFHWPDAGWRGRPWEEAVIYELHVGTFTREGTFAAVEARLDDLAQLGVTAIELMPVGDFPGRRNWGYDGTLVFAPDASYGTPADLKRLVAAAHSRGLMMLLDVVYNHFGPEGNYLARYAPQFFNPRHRTPWGAAINFDGDGARTVREFFIHNALYWLEEYHFDGLRLDAVHAIADEGKPHFVAELADRVQAGPGRDRHIHLVLENDRNAAHLLARAADGTATAAVAQWNDDVHHALHVLATGEVDGYYADYAALPLACAARALASGFVFQGEPSPYRQGEPRGEPSGHLPPAAFINFLQTHDQVGNRAMGERIAALAPPELLRLVVVCTLLGPAIPLLFMGEEFAASTPFLFFCDFSPEVSAAVRDGRRAEFARFARFADPTARDRIPDPGSEATFTASRLDWSEREAPGHREWLSLYRHLLGIRAARIVPLLAGAQSGGTCELVGASGLAVRWPLGDATVLHLLANFGTYPLGVHVLPEGERLFLTPGIADDQPMPAFSVIVTLEGPADA